MSDLAFTQNGDSFEVPATVTGWRVRRLKPRGAPELVYGRDGRPLVMPVECEMDELRGAVGTLGKYRLDPVDDNGKVIDGIPAAYVQVVKPDKPSEEASTAAPLAERDSVIREAMRMNTELAKTVVDRFPEMMHAAAELLRAADGAGLPAREPRATEDDNEDDDQGDDEEPEQRPGFDLNALVAQVVPMIVMALGNGKMPGLGELLDWRKAAPAAKPRAKDAKATKPAEAAEAAHATVPENATDVLPPIDPQTMAHFIAVQSALTPEEAAIAREVARELSAPELRAWFDELSTLSVPDAVAKVRKLISGFGKNGGAS